MSQGCEVAVVGAGPHGLAVAAHLREAVNDVRVFGEVMEFWRRGMPAGMVLRSERAGSHIADPRRQLTLEHYEGETGAELPARIPLRDYISYGDWYQRKAVPEVDGRRVRRIEHDGERFRLVLDDEVVRANRVIVATGLESFASRPKAFAGIPASVAPHASEVGDPSAFAGMAVAVVGAGQSALEISALLHEAGASVEVLIRAPTVRFLSGRKLFYDTPLRRLFYPPGELGPPGINWIIELPGMFHSLPVNLQDKVTAQIGPVGAAWLRPRLQDVPIITGRTVTTATAVGSKLHLTLDDATVLHVDRVVLATGYKIEVDRYSILAPPLTRALRRRGCYPDLADGFESSVPGLHFVGAAAAANYGPLMRFVAGTGYTGRAIARHVMRSRAARRGPQLPLVGKPVRSQ